MGEERRKRDWPILISVIAAIALVPLGLYVGGYYWLAETEETPFRSFPNAFFPIRPTVTW